MEAQSPSSSDCSAIAMYVLMCGSWCMFAESAPESASRFLLRSPSMPFLARGSSPRQEWPQLA